MELNEINNTDIIFEIISYKLLENIPILKEYKLVQKDKKINTVVTEYTSYSILFSAIQFKREFVCSLIDYYSDQRMSFQIRNTEVEGKGIVTNLSLDDYITKHLGIETIDIMKLNKYEADAFNEKLQLFFKQIVKIVDSQFYDILQGERWIEIPFDWKNYK